MYLWQWFWVFWRDMSPQGDMSPISSHFHFFIWPSCYEQITNHSKCSHSMLPLLTVQQKFRNVRAELFGLSVLQKHVLDTKGMFHSPLNICPKRFWSSIYLTGYASKLCRNTHRLSHKVVSKLTEEHTNWNGLPFFCCKIIQYLISWICIRSSQDVTHIQIDKVIFNKHSAEMWTNLKIYYNNSKETHGCYECFYHYHRVYNQVLRP